MAKHKSKKFKNIKKNHKAKTSHKRERLPDSLFAKLKQLNLQLVEIEGDGNCLFRSLCHQLEEHDKNYAHYRNIICEYINLNRSYFKDFLIDETIEQHIKRMKMDKVYGGYLELVAFCMLKKLCVHVVNYSNGTSYAIVENKVNETNRNLYIIYDEESEHYSSTRKAIKGNQLEYKT